MGPPSWFAAGPRRSLTEERKDGAMLWSATASIDLWMV